MSKKLKIIISIILSILIIFIGIFLIVSNNSPVGEKYSKEFIKSINYIKKENYIEAYNIIKNSDKDEKNIKLKKQFIDYIIIFMFLIVAVGNSLGFISSLVEDETGLKSNKIAPWVSRYKYNKIVYLENNNLQSEDKINYIKDFIKEEPYLYQNIMYEIMGNTIIEIMNNNNIDKELKKKYND